MGSPQLDFLVLVVAGVIFFCSNVDGGPKIPGVPFCSATENSSPDYNWLKFKAVEGVIRYTGRNNNNYYVIAQFGKRTCYAHGSCFLSDIEYPDSCSECLRGAEAVILDTCGPFAVGAQLNLAICHLRYEDYVFTEGMLREYYVSISRDDRVSSGHPQTRIAWNVGTDASDDWHRGLNNINYVFIPDSKKLIMRHESAAVPSYVVVIGAQDTMEIYMTCATWIDNSLDYRLIRRDVRQALVRHTWRHNYNYYISATSNNHFCYGHGVCNVNPADLSCPGCRASIDSQCERCLAAADQKIIQRCHPDVLGA